MLPVLVFLKATMKMMNSVLEQFKQQLMRDVEEDKDILSIDLLMVIVVAVLHKKQLHLPIFHFINFH